MRIKKEDDAQQAYWIANLPRGSVMLDDTSRKKMDVDALIILVTIAIAAVLAVVKLSKSEVDIHPSSSPTNMPQLLPSGVRASRPFTVPNLCLLDPRLRRSQGPS